MPEASPSEQPVIQNLRGKSIAVVGGASSIFNQQNGERIDQADTVIRMNRSYPKKPLHQGRRTDLITLSCDIPRWRHWLYYKSAPTLWMSPKRENVPTWLQKRSDLSYYPEDYWQLLSEKLGGHRPSTGAMTLDLICSHVQPEQLDLYGFDFKKSNTLYQKKPKPGPHNWTLEEAFVFSLIESAQSSGKQWAIH